MTLAGSAWTCERSPATLTTGWESAPGAWRGFTKRRCAVVPWARPGVKSAPSAPDQALRTLTSCAGRAMALSSKLTLTSVWLFPTCVSMAAAKTQLDPTAVAATRAMLWMRMVSNVWTLTSAKSCVASAATALA